MAQKPCGFRTILGAVLVSGTAGQAFAKPVNLPQGPSFKANSSQICVDSRLDRTRLVSWYYYNPADIEVSKNFKTVDDLLEALDNSSAEQGKGKRSSKT